jgi:hypothetical protein
MSLPERMSLPEQVESQPGEPEPGWEWQSVPGLADGLHRFLDLGVAQLDAAVRDSDLQAERLAASLAALDSEPHVPERGLRAGGAPEADGPGGHLQAAINTLRFYDKLRLRLAHVRDGLAIPLEAALRAPGSAPPDWDAILQQVRACYTSVEERVLFDFMMSGLSTTEMLKALESLRAASLPGAAGDA